MTARQPRRRRRLQAAAAPLPRPSATPARDIDDEPDMHVEEDESGDVTVALPSRTRRGVRRSATFGQRTHHVTTDYSYVHKDLVTIAAVSVITLAFILAMWLILG